MSVLRWLCDTYIKSIFIQTWTHSLKHVHVLCARTSKHTRTPDIVCCLFFVFFPKGVPCVFYINTWSPKSPKKKYRTAFFFFWVCMISRWTYQHPLLLFVHPTALLFFFLLASLSPHHSVCLPNTTTLLILSSLFPPSHTPFFSRPLRAIMELIACLMNSPWTWNSRLLAVWA